MGLEHAREPHVKHIEGRLWEMRLKGRSGISRALYVAAAGCRIVIVRVFVRKTEKTPRCEIELALARAKVAGSYSNGLFRSCAAIEAADASPEGASVRPAKAGTRRCRVGPGYVDRSKDIPIRRAGAGRRRRPAPARRMEKAGGGFRIQGRPANAGCPPSLGELLGLRPE